MNLRPEWIALTMNLMFFVRYAWQWQEPGKIIYWAGACVMTVGLLKMRG